MSPQPAAAAAEDGGDVVRVRVWDAPLRIMHWTLVLCILLLSLTGFYIATPIFGSSSASGYTMGVLRTVHITVAWLFTAVLVARVYWAFAGNRWAKWDQLIAVRPERRKKLRPSVEYYMFRRLEPPPVVGHNPLAGATYLVLFVMFAAQAITGFALEALSNPDGLMWRLTSWVFRVLPIPEVRLFHDMVMWLTLGFVVHHVYSAWLVDHEEQSGEISSIVTGWKTLPRGRLEAETAPSPPRQRRTLRARVRSVRRVDPEVPGGD